MEFVQANAVQAKQLAEWQGHEWDEVYPHCDEFRERLSALVTERWRV